MASCYVNFGEKIIEEKDGIEVEKTVFISSTPQLRQTNTAYEWITSSDEPGTSTFVIVAYREEKEEGTGKSNFIEEARKEFTIELEE
jgi:hypothetical protein